MSKYLNITNGDYYVTTPTGKITLDSATVEITGDLTLRGGTTIVSSADLSVKDNIIVVNAGETGSGISLGSAGLQIDRGTRPDAFFVYDESLPDPVTPSSPGQFVFRTDGGVLKGIRTNSVSAPTGDLFLIGTGTGAVSVGLTTDYEQRIFNYVDGAISAAVAGTIIVDNNDDRIPNTRALIDYVQYSFDTLGLDGISSIQDTDKDTYIIAETPSESPEGIDNDQLEFFAAGVKIATIDQAGFRFGSPFTNTIGTESGDLILDPAPVGTTGSVIIQGNLIVQGQELILVNGLGVGSGGTGASTFSANGILYGDATNPLKSTSSPGPNNVSTSNEILTIGSAGEPVWTDTIDEGTY
jgi:hypothetical protein